MGVSKALSVAILLFVALGLPVRVLANDPVSNHADITANMRNCDSANAGGFFSAQGLFESSFHQFLGTGGGAATWVAHGVAVGYALLIALVGAAFLWNLLRIAAEADGNVGGALRTVTFEIIKIGAIIGLFSSLTLIIPGLVNSLLAAGGQVVLGPGGQFGAGNVGTVYPNPNAFHPTYYAALGSCFTENIMTVGGGIINDNPQMMSFDIFDSHHWVAFLNCLVALVAGLLACVVMALSMVLISANLILVAIEVYFVGGLAPIAFAFGGAPLTRPIAERMFASLFGLAMKLAALVALGGFARQLGASWTNLLLNDVYVDKPLTLATASMEIVIGALLFGLLALLLPNLVGQHFGGGSLNANTAVLAVRQVSSPLTSSSTIASSGGASQNGGGNRSGSGGGGAGVGAGANGGAAGRSTGASNGAPPPIRGT